MRAILAITVVAVMAATTPTFVQEGPATRLLVVLVVDQLRADYLTTFAQRWRGGFRELTERGARFVNAEYPYWSTVTCAGHSTISTGALPRTHGMVLNRWWDRTERRVVACTDDASVAPVTYGRAAKAGHSAARLLTPTLADELRSQRPGARAVSISLKPRSAIGLVGHGGDAVVWFDESVGSFVTSRAFAQAAVPAVAAFVARDNFEADQSKVWALADRPESYRFGEIVGGERPNLGWTSVFPHRIAGTAPLDAAFIDHWQKSPYSDAYLARMAHALIDEWKLGQRDVTDFLGISFSALDMVGHDFGPRSREVEDVLIALDGAIGTLIRRLDEVVGRDRYVLALTADHGVATIPEQVGAGRVANEDVGDTIEQALVGEWGAPPSGTYVASTVGGQVYFAPGIFDRLRGSVGAMQKVEAALLAIPGLARVVRSDRLDANHSDAVTAAIARGYQAERSGDLFIIPKQDWIVEQRSDNDATTHGTMYEYDRRVPVILMGRGVKAGSFSAGATPADIAPTLASLAGISLPKAEGRVLREATH